MVQGLVNSFGSVVMAAFSVAVKIDSFAYMPVSYTHLDVYKRQENEAALDGMVKLMFQSGEEPLTGARSMIADGLLQDPRPDVALGYHVVAGSMPMGLFVYNREGTLMNRCV